MMSQNGFQETFQSSLHPEGTMDLFIETLTGTAFEMTVSPFDTVMSIKSKIQKVEGIPVSHQHLLYNMQELDDGSCLLDHSIQNGATLKLVLSMRGGPISTRRLPSGDEFAWKELREFVETNREDMFENLPPGCRVTVLVFREADQVNLFRVIENEDGTYSPLSESWSGSSIRNLFAEEDPDDAAKRLQENSVTMGKMQELKSKMEAVALQRKPKNLTPQPPRVSSTKRTSLHLRKDPPRSQNTKPATPEPRSRSQQNFLQLPPIKKGATAAVVPNRSQQSLSNRYLATSSLLTTQHQQLSRRARDLETKATGQDSNTNTEGHLMRIAKRDASDSVRQSGLPMVVSNSTKPAGSRRGSRILTSTFPDIKPQRNVEYGAGRSIRRSEVQEESKTSTDDGNNCTNILSTSNIAIVEEESHSTVEKEEPDFPPPPNPIPVLSQETTTFTVQLPRERVTTALGSGNRYRVSRFVLDEDDRPKTSPDKLPQQHKTTQELCDILSETKWRRHRRQQVQCSNGQVELLQGLPRTADDEYTQGTAHLSNKRSTDRSSLDLSMPVASTLNVTVSARYSRRSVLVPSNIQDINKERNQSETSKLVRQDVEMRPRQQTRRQLSAVGEGSEKDNKTSLLPAGTKKMTVRSRCAQCKKRLNITNIYTCRCEKLFCSAHRYSELHSCTFDYKTEGRKLLEQANPLVTAPKLPKI